MKHPLSFLTLAPIAIAEANASVSKLTANDGAPLDRFGTAIAANSQFILIGSPRDDDHGSSCGSVYLFDTVSRKFLRKITPADGAAGDEFGAAISTCGTRAFLGARFEDDQGTNSGSAYLFDLTTGSLIRKLSGTSAGDQFGKAVAMNSTRLAVTAWLAAPNGEHPPFPRPPVRPAGCLWGLTDKVNS
jgi:hypothetical protein